MTAGMGNGRLALTGIKESHNVSPSTKTAERKAPTDELAETGEVGCNVEVLLGTTTGYPEADHLVENEYDAQSTGDVPQHLEVVPIGRDHTGGAQHRFYHH